MFNGELFNPQLNESESHIVSASHFCDRKYLAAYIGSPRLGERV